MHLQMEQGGWGAGGGEGKRREACVNSCMVHELKASGTCMYASLSEVTTFNFFSLNFSNTPAIT